MPGGDGTGPMGTGPMTGRGAGYCAGNAAPGYGNSAVGSQAVNRGTGVGRGRGFARRNAVYAAQPDSAPYQSNARPYGPRVDMKTEIEILKTEAANLENVLKSINERLAQLSEEK